MSRAWLKIVTTAAAAACAACVMAPVASASSEPGTSAELSGGTSSTPQALLSSEPADASMTRERAVEVLAFGPMTEEQVQKCVDFYDQGKVGYSPNPWRCPSAPSTQADVDKALEYARGDLSVLVTAFSHFGESKAAFYFDVNSDPDRFMDYLWTVLSAS